MPWWAVVSVLLGTLICFSVIHFAAKNKRPLRRALLSMILGVGVLMAIDCTSGLTNVYIPVSVLSLLTSVIGGVPGVTLLLLLNLFF